MVLVPPDVAVYGTSALIGLGLGLAAVVFLRRISWTPAGPTWAAPIGGWEDA